MGRLGKRVNVVRGVASRGAAVGVMSAAMLSMAGWDDGMQGI